MIVRPHWMAGGWGFNWPGLVTAVLFWALVVVAIIALIRYLRGRQHWPGPPGYGWPGPGPHPQGRSPAEHILAERYARGEIGEEEYQRRLSVLRGGAGQPPPPPGTGPPPGSAPPPAS